MGVIDYEKYYLKKEEMLKFIYSNQDKYDDRGIDKFRDIISDYYIDKNFWNIPVSYFQIFSKFGVFKEGQDIYLEFFKLLNELNFLEGNVCEVGAGGYPRLAEIMLPKIKLNGGTLTIYEPEILYTDFKGIKIVKEKFTEDTNIESIDTLVGLMPCIASESIVEQAFFENKNLLIGFCECDHSSRSGIKKGNNKYWAEALCNYYKKRYGNEAEILSLFDNIGVDIPIMVRHKR